MAQVTPESVTDPNFLATALNALRQGIVETREQVVQSRHLLKPAKPPTFDGRFTQDKGLARTWLFTVEQYFAGCGVTADNTKLLFITTLLTGNASTWWRAQFRLQPDGTLQSNITTWSAFRAALLKQFEPINSAKIARDKIATLRQGKSVQEYTARFQSLVLDIPDMADSEKIDRYTRGLKHHIQREIELRQFSTLEEIMQAADRLDTIDFRFRREPAFPTGRHVPQGPTPMELGSMQAPWSEEDADALLAMRGKPLTADDRARLRKMGACYYCKEPGHIAVNCPKKLVAENRRSQ